MELLLEENGLEAKDCIMIGNDFQADVGSALSVDMRSVYLNTYDLSKSEMKARLKHTMDEHAKESTRKPVIIESGDFMELFPEIFE